MSNTNEQQWPSNVVSLAAHRFLKLRKGEETEYAMKIEKLEKSELLQELLRYDDTVKRHPSNMQAVLRAQMLMELLESRAELTELRELAVEYKRKLATRLYAQVQNISQDKPI